MRDFDSSHLDGLEEAENTLYNELEDNGDSRIGLRPGYDEAPNQHDLQNLLTPESERFQESDVDVIEDFHDFVDEYFGDSQYVDWNLTGFDDLCPWEQESFQYRDGSELVVEVYEPGAEGHNVLRL
jgi:hypothetical protein